MSKSFAEWLTYQDLSEFIRIYQVSYHEMKFAQVE